MGMARSQQLNGSSSSQVVSELDLRIKALYVLGFELAYNPAATSFEGDGLVFQSRLRMAAQVYFLPLDMFSMYLTAGIGSDHMKDLVNLTGDNTSYHGGLGAEVYVGENMAIGAEYLMLIPGVRSVQKTIVSSALQSVVNTPGSPSAPQLDMESLTASDFINPGNFQATLSFRYYF